MLKPNRAWIWSVDFKEGGKRTGEPREKPSEQGENQQQTQPIHVWQKSTKFTLSWQFVTLGNG